MGIGMLKPMRRCHGRAVLIYAALVTIANMEAAVAQSANPFAGWLGGANYQLYSGDVNSDGYPDLLAKSKPKLIPIAVDDITIVIPKRASPTFVLLSSGGSYSLVINPANSIKDSSVWQLDSFTIVLGDILGDGSGSALIRASVPGGTSFTVATSMTDGNPQLVQVISSAELGVDLGGPGKDVKFSDANDDGRSDLIVRTNGLITDVFVSDASGRFTRQPGAEGSIAVAWNAFRASLKANEISSAINFFASDVRDEYQGVMQALSDSLSDLPEQWAPLLAVAVSNEYGIYLLDQVADGTTRSHLIVFERQGGRWVLSEF